MINLLWSADVRNDNAYLRKEDGLPAMDYRPEIDGLRAIAVIPVMLFHAGFEVFSGGFVGVDVFFVVSGYLITLIIISEMDQGRFSIVRFYERRARRIFPALFVVMLCCIPFAWTWMVPSQFDDFSKSLIAVSFFASNILFWRESGYFDAAAEEKPLLHTWSLAVEEQFYIFFPFLLLLLGRFGRSPLLYIFMGLSVLSLLLAEYGWRNHPAANFYLIPTRAWELGVGAVCALLMYRTPRRESAALSLAGLALILLSVFYYDRSTPFPSLYALAPVGGTALVILFTASPGWVAKLLSLRAFVGIGLISYSAYLWHQPLFAFARIRSLTEPDPVEIMALSALSLGLAALSWKFVELPFRKVEGTLTTTTVCLVFPAAVGFMLAFGAAGHVTSGYKDAHFSDMQKAVLETASSSPKRSECHSRMPQNACVYMVDNYEWAVFGNSHGVELAYSLARKLREYGIGLKHYTISGCMPVYGQSQSQEDQPGCIDWTEGAIGAIRNDKNISTVVISYRHETSSGDDWRSYIETIQVFLEAGKRTIVVLQAPLLPKHIEFFAARLSSPTDSIEGVKRKDWESTYSIARAPQSNIPHRAIIIDPSNVFCDNSSCYSIIAGKALYFDDNHMSIFGGNLVADEILKSVGIVALSTHSQHQ